MKPLKFSRITALLLALAGVSGLGAAHADTLQDAQRLLKLGQLSQALEKTDQFLADKPKDAQGRFLRGLILTEMNKQGEAIAAFTKLTEDYPELPEPYNNLAVIYAQQRQYDKAKSALEMAIRTHPSYATAHENLGDVYARMASQAYDKALQLDSTNVVAQNKLAMIRELMSVTAKPSAKPTATAAAKPAVQPPAQVAAAPAAAPAPAATPAPAKPAPEAKPAAEAKPAVEAKPAAPAAKPAPVAVAKPAEAAPAAGDDKAEVEKTVRSWAAAWSAKDVKTYLTHYAKDFDTPDRMSRSAWEKQRHQRIDKPGSIEVNIDQIEIVVQSATKAVAKFRQHYRSANLDTTGVKTLDLIKSEGRWLIQQERISS